VATGKKGKRARSGAVAKGKRRSAKKPGQRERKTLRGLGLSPTFRSFVDPVRSDRRKRPIYVVLDIEPPTERYKEATFTVPLRIGTMEGRSALRLSDSAIAEIAKIHGLKVKRVRGLARLKPSKDRKGRRFSRAAKRNR